MSRRNPIGALQCAMLARSAILAAQIGGDTPELCRYTAKQILELIQQKKASAREVMDAHLRQIERINLHVNAIVTLLPEQARELAGKADEAQAKGAALGPLHGLPTAHKDLVETAGVRTTFGSRIFQDYVPAQDALLVERVRKAGAISVGKTNTPEFGAGSQTFNEVFGATRNPYDLSKTCGGSSGGAAVSLACRMLPVADGSDSGGSLRNPAAFCNVIGFRPSPGRVPENASWSTLGVGGPMARTVADAALLLSVLAGPDPLCPISITESGEKFAGDLGRDFRGARVAWFRDIGGAPFDRSIRTVVNAQRKVFEDLGCVVEEAEPDWTGGDVAYRTLRALGYFANCGDAVRDHPDLVKDTIRGEVDRGARLTASDLVRAEAARVRVWSAMRHFQQRYEFFVVPSTQVPPFDIALPYVMEIEGVKMNTYIDWMKCCWMITIVECPALSVPCGFTPEGLPVGLQIVGRHRDEFAVLQLAHAYEQATQHYKASPV